MKRSPAFKRVSALLCAAVLGAAWGNWRPLGPNRSAHAFSGIYLFDAPADTKSFGGGGRFFTGSLLDGMTCEVCHVPVGRFDIEVSGFDGRIVPGKTYDLEVSWSGDAKRVAFNAEIVGPDGKTAGEVFAPDAASDSSESPTEGSASRADPVEIIKLDSGRIVFGASRDEEREASKVPFRWRAPDKSFEGPVWVHVSAIRAKTVSSFYQDAEGDDTSPLVGNHVGVFRGQFKFGAGADYRTQKVQDK